MSPFPDSSLCPEDTPFTGFSLETLTFFSELLKQVTISAADPGFDKATETIKKVRQELERAINLANAG